MQKKTSPLLVSSFKCITLFLLKKHFAGNVQMKCLFFLLEMGHFSRKRWNDCIFLERRFFVFPHFFNPWNQLVLPSLMFPCRKQTSSCGHGAALCSIPGNKSDLTSKRTVTKDEGEAKAQRTNCLFIETSAKTGTGIQNLFTKVCDLIVSKWVRGGECCIFLFLEKGFSGVSCCVHKTEFPLLFLACFKVCTTLFCLCF